jgi:hypothetical protein
VSSRDPTWDEVVQDLRELVAAMRPFLDQAVLCGCWAAYLYRHLPGVSVASAPLLTKDFDWALPRDLGTTAGSLDACLVSGSFVSVPCGDSIPAVTRYQHERWGRDQLGPVYAELLVPLHGAAHYAYLFETAVCTRRTWALLKDRIGEIEGSRRLHGTWLRRVRTDLARWYRDAASDGVVGACRVVRSVPERASTTEAQVERIMGQFLTAVGLR